MFNDLDYKRKDCYHMVINKVYLRYAWMEILVTMRLEYSEEEVS